MRARVLIALLCLLPMSILAKQEEFEENDLELFEFIAMYDKKDVFFIDDEIDKKEQVKDEDNTIVSGSDE